MGERAEHLDCRECEKAVRDGRTLPAVENTCQHVGMFTFQRHLDLWMSEYHRSGHVGG